MSVMLRNAVEAPSLEVAQTPAELALVFVTLHTQEAWIEDFQRSLLPMFL